MSIPNEQLEEATRLLHRLEDRVPANVRDLLKLCHRIEGNAIVLFEFRPTFSRPGEWHEEPVAKFVYVTKNGFWKLQWMGRTRRWRAYGELPQAATFRELYDEVVADPWGCFFG